MSNIPSGDLFELIQSLSGSEKRYFKLYASKTSSGKNSIYVELFDQIEKKNTYDEKRILQEVKSLKKEQLSNVKKYLFDLILESMQMYHADRSIATQINKNISSIEFLFEKRLFEQCYKLIVRTKDLAARYEKFSELLAILAWEEKIYVTESASSLVNYEKSIGISDEATAITEKLKSIDQYAKLFNTLKFIFRKEGILRDAKANPKLEKLMQHPLLKKPPLKNASFSEQYYYYAINSFYNLFTDNWPVQYQYHKALVDLTEANHEQIQSNPHKYIDLLNTFIVSCVMMKKYWELEKTFQKVHSLLKDPQFKNRESTIVPFLQCCNSMIYFYCQSGEFENGRKLFAEIEPLMAKRELRMSQTFQISFDYGLAYTFFGMGDYKSSLFWLNKILNSPSSVDVRDDIQSFARIFNIILHYELKNDLMLEYITKATYRFLLKKKKLYKVETLVMNFIRKSATANTNQEMLRLFESLKQDIVETIKDPNEKKALIYFNLVAWLESKTAKKGFAETVKKIFKQESSIL